MKNATIRNAEPLSRNAESTKYRAKISSQAQSLTGRAHKLLGRAGAAKLRATGEHHRFSSKSVNGVARSPESTVFEGFRAHSSQGKGTLKTAGRNGRKHSKPSNRSKEFKAKGRKKKKP